MATDVLRADLPTGLRNNLSNIRYRRMLPDTPLIKLSNHSYDTTECTNLPPAYRLLH